MKVSRVLLIGYGNPGRLDDGLGPACAEVLQKLDIHGVTVESDYQLSVEHSALAAQHECVIFVDAAVCGSEPFELREVTGTASVGFSSHSVEPEVVIALARDLFNARPRAYTLAIRGYRFNDFGESLSERAEQNLSAAVVFLKNAFSQCRFDAGDLSLRQTDNPPKCPGITIPSSPVN